MNPLDKTLSWITLGGGCFWCLDAAFRRLRGVHHVEPGYSNGSHPAPTYEAVCSGHSGHAEVVRVGFDPAEVSLQDLLAVFFTLHDPTSLNRQGADVGTQYRSAIFIHEPAQADLARAMLPPGAVTQIEPVRNYHPAEPLHHDYHARNPDQGYCVVVIDPKLDHLQRAHAALLR